MNAQHTPGPWHVWPDSFERFGPEETPDVYVGNASEHSALILSQGLPGQVEANARLIAAAPEMLTALRDAENWLGELDAGPDTGAQALIAELRAAIAKAEGR